MIILIAGSTHTGKTKLAQDLLEKYKYPYLSIDHLKMGLIRSGNTTLTPLSDDDLLTDYLWPIVVEMIKTAIENNQNLIVEGCYIPFNYKDYFTLEYLKHIKYYCLIMSRKYLENNFENLLKYQNIIEQRLDQELDLNELISDNEKKLKLASENKVNYILIDDSYKIDIEDL